MHRLKHLKSMVNGFLKDLRMRIGRLRVSGIVDIVDAISSTSSEQYPMRASIDIRDNAVAKA